MRKTWLSLAAKSVVSVGMIAWLLGSVDMAAAWGEVREVGVAAPLGVLGLILMVQLPIGVARWWVVQAAIAAPLNAGRLARFFMIGMFFNQFLPSSVGGDAVRIYKAYRSGLTLSQAFNGVLLERAAIVLSLILLVAALQPLLAERVAAPGLLWVFPLLAVGAVGGIVFLMVLDRLPARFRRWRVVRGLVSLAQDSRRVFLSPLWGGGGFALSLLGNLNLVLMIYVLALGMDLGIGLLDCLVLVPPAMLIGTLPISIAGWGVREGAMVASLGMIGVPAESALVVSMLFGVCALIGALPGGLLWAVDREDLREVEKATDHGLG